MKEYQVSVSMNGHFLFRTDWGCFRFAKDAKEFANKIADSFGFGCEARVYSRVPVVTLEEAILGGYNANKQ